ncbi:MAG: hypothetical protein ABI868_00195 [Acidobacteriota bacterium]
MYSYGTGRVLLRQRIVKGVQTKVSVRADLTKSVATPAIFPTQIPLYSRRRLAELLLKTVHQTSAAHNQELTTSGSTIMKYLIFSTALLIGACSAAPSPQTAAAPSHITYRAVNLSRTGPARASITFQNGTNRSDQTEVTMPWETTFTVSPGARLYIAAQNLDNVGGIQVFILKNGREVATGEAVGENAIATAAAAS